MANIVDAAIAKAITTYSEECEKEGRARDMAEQGRRVAAVVEHADPLDLLASDYWTGLEPAQAVLALRDAMLKAFKPARNYPDPIETPAPIADAEPKPRKARASKGAALA